MMVSPMNETTETSSSIFRARRELVGGLVARNLKIRYKSSALGFGGIIPNYLQYLVTGIIVWQFTISCMNDSLYCIVGNANLVKKVFFPRAILPLSTALANGVNFLLTFLVLVVYLVATGNAHFARLWLLLPAFAMQLAMCFGLCCLCGTSNVFFRDIQYIYTVFTTAWLYLTPIFYEVDMLPSNLQIVVKYLNPMLYYVSQFRSVVLYKAWPGGKMVIAGCGAAVLTFIVGAFVFNRKQDDFILYI